MHNALKIAAVVAATMLVSACNKQADPAAAQQQLPPTAVGVMTVKAQPQSIEVELPGRSRAFLEAEVRPQVSGIITSREFAEGGEVTKGQSLYQIDSATYDATLISAKADLASALASLSSTKATAERYKALLSTNAISKQDYDEAFSAYQSAKASVVVAEAAINTAKINVQYTEVKAPISGRIGKSAVTAGALVTANQSNTLATIQQLDPINVDIAQSSAQMLRLKNQLKAGKLLKSENATVKLILEDGSTYDQLGKLQFAEVSVDETTGSVIIRAEFPNPDGMLLPGMYVRAILETGTDPEAILVPQKALTRNSKGQAVAMIVNDNNTVESRNVKTAEVIGNQWRITSGLKAGDKLIVEGLQKIRPGAPVSPQVLSTKTPQE
ncbi:efflux RND transporter periplasmic adaptor subunit [Shewanella intestini]|uniref:Efflux RND transporter periplasmic adaptor subunit n=1 Tax=Shewanella intestini TaxID=2017544 RepID=A0ABS5I5U8_9GAMM|nr:MULTISPECIES: efflux RND transporter periplasmic adaptor subunit [Shewanella]MBR9729089.1 efflux RND transporter periplasmic adaptor subunit [Shewanella intestini]MRG37165.1 efflux RND transporter periplasmic adaptor subunit [Shewanella sp. XMDDZSB0408]